MSSIPAGKRCWKCPDCGQEVLLSITQLDPLACDACLAKLKGGGSESGNVLQTVQAQPEIVKLAAVALVSLLLGLVIGFVAGRATATDAGRAVARSSSSDSVGREGEFDSDDSPDESTRPGPGYRWVRGYTRKDGVKVKGHWAKAPKYADPDGSSKKRAK